MASTADADAWPDRATPETFARLEAAARRIVGSRARVIAEQPDGIPVIRVLPHRQGARSVTLIADQWIVLEVESGGGGRWELTYDESGISFAEKAIEAVAAGRIREWVGPGRSRVELTFDDGSVHVETGRRGIRGVLPGRLRSTDRDDLRRY